MGLKIEQWDFGASPTSQAKIASLNKKDEELLTFVSLAETDNWTDDIDKRTVFGRINNTEFPSMLENDTTTFTDDEKQKIIARTLKLSKEYILPSRPNSLVQLGIHRGVIPNCSSAGAPIDCHTTDATMTVKKFTFDENFENVIEADTITKNFVVDRDTSDEDRETARQLGLEMYFDVDLYPYVNYKQIGGIIYSVPEDTKLVDVKDYYEYFIVIKTSFESSNTTHLRKNTRTGVVETLDSIVADKGVVTREKVELKGLIEPRAYDDDDFKTRYNGDPIGPLPAGTVPIVGQDPIVYNGPLRGIDIGIEEKYMAFANSDKPINLEQFTTTTESEDNALPVEGEDETITITGTEFGDFDEDFEGETIDIDPDTGLATSQRISIQVSSGMTLIAKGGLVRAGGFDFVTHINQVVGDETERTDEVSRIPNAAPELILYDSIIRRNTQVNITNIPAGYIAEYKFYGDEDWISTPADNIIPLPGNFDEDNNKVMRTTYNLIFRTKKVVDADNTLISVERYMKNIWVVSDSYQLDPETHKDMNDPLIFDAGYFTFDESGEYVGPWHSSLWRPYKVNMPFTELQFAVGKFSIQHNFPIVYNEIPSTDDSLTGTLTEQNSYTGQSDTDLFEGPFEETNTDWYRYTNFVWRPKSFAPANASPEQVLASSYFRFMGTTPDGKPWLPRAWDPPYYGFMTPIFKNAFYSYAVSLMIDERESTTELAAIQTYTFNLKFYKIRRWYTEVKIDNGDIISVGTEVEVPGDLYCDIRDFRYYYVEHVDDNVTGYRDGGYPNVDGSITTERLFQVRQSIVSVERHTISRDLALGIYQEDVNELSVDVDHTISNRRLIHHSRFRPWHFIFNSYDLGIYQQLTGNVPRCYMVEDTYRNAPQDSTNQFFDIRSINNKKDPLLYDLDLFIYLYSTATSIIKDRYNLITISNVGKKESYRYLPVAKIDVVQQMSVPDDNVYTAIDFDNLDEEFKTKTDVQKELSRYLSKFLRINPYTPHKWSGEDGSYRFPNRHYQYFRIPLDYTSTSKTTTVDVLDIETSSKYSKTLGDVQGLLSSSNYGDYTYDFHDYDFGMFNDEGGLDIMGSSLTGMGSNPFNDSDSRYTRLGDPLTRSIGRDILAASTQSFKLDKEESALMRKYSDKRYKKMLGGGRHIGIKLPNYDFKLEKKIDLKITKLRGRKNGQ